MVWQPPRDPRWYFEVEPVGGAAGLAGATGALMPLVAAAAGLVAHMDRSTYRLFPLLVSK